MEFIQVQQEGGTVVSRQQCPMEGKEAGRILSILEKKGLKGYLHRDGLDLDGGDLVYPGVITFVPAVVDDVRGKRQKVGSLEMCSGDFLEDIEKQAQNVRKSYQYHPELLWDSASALFLPTLSHPTCPKEKLYVGRKGAQKLYDELENIEKLAQNVRKSYLSHPEFLWDSASALFLPALSHPTCPKEKLYVGRKGAQKLYDEVNRLTRRESLLVVGAKGSGKSTVAEAIAGHLIVSGKHAVYMRSKDLQMDKMDTLLGALLLAFFNDEPYYSQLKNLAYWVDLLDWCMGKIGPLYFFIDDWEFNDDERLEELSACFRRHILVKVSSTNSKEHRDYMDTDKPKEKYGSLCYFDGPYTAEELETWIANSDLAKEFRDKDSDKLTEWYGRVDYWTGGMPRLLEKFTDVKGDEEKMKIEMTFYVNRMKAFINAAMTKNDTVRCLVMINKGDQVCGDFDSACFYQDESKLWHPLCPYLQREGEIMILNKAGLLERKLLLDDIRTWANAVRIDTQQSCRSMEKY